MAWKLCLNPKQAQEYCYQLATVQAMLKVGRTLVFSEDKMDGVLRQHHEFFKARNAGRRF
jgi:16S rRNA G1207 methylase RsmC